MNKSNLKLFDLEAAKRGERVITEQGHVLIFVAHTPQAEEYSRVVFFHPASGRHYICSEKGEPNRHYGRSELFMASEEGGTMNINEYQELALRTLKEGKPEDHLLHAGMGLCTEAGEVMDALKRTWFYGKALDKEKLITECGDLLWYLAVMAQSLRISLEEIAKMNISKLRARYPEGFTEHDALNRDLDIEAIAMFEQ